MARVAYSRSPAASRASALSLNSSAWIPFPPRMPFRARRVADLICNGGYSSRCVSPHAAHVNGESMIRMPVPTGYGSGIRSPVLGHFPCRRRSFTPPSSTRAKPDYRR